MKSHVNLKKTFYLHTLGCKVNQYESQVMRECLLSAGFDESSSMSAADICVINTCTVTEKADSESRHMVCAFRKSNPKTRIVVTGCYVEKNSEDIASLPGVSRILKNTEKNRIVDILHSAFADNDHVSETGSSRRPKITGFKGHTRPFVKVQDGCENRCAYCKVPLVRGPLKSRALNDIVDEVSGLLDSGFKEIVLTGICLGAWGRDIETGQGADSTHVREGSIEDVLEAINGLRGDFRIRISSIEPRYVTDRLIDYIRRSKNICKHIHIPLQSGDDYILKRMNRPYSSGEYKSLIENIRSQIDGVAVTTDVIVGFPGESPCRFKNTLDFVTGISPARTHIFTFSKRPGTAAYEMDGEVDPVEAKKRYRDMEGKALEASKLYVKAFVGKAVRVLVESRRDAGSGLLTGYSDNYIKVIFEGPDAIMGNIVPVTITEPGPAVAAGVYGSCQAI